MVWDQGPTFVNLALDVSFAGLPLGIQRVEFQIEVMFGRFASVDSAAD